MQLKSTRAACWRNDFNAFTNQRAPAKAQAYLKRWCCGAKRARLEPIREFVKIVEERWDAIIT